MDLAESAPGALDVGLQQVDGLAELEPLLSPGLLDGADQRRGTPANAALKAVEIAPIQRLAAGQEPRFDQRGADLGVLAGQRAGFVDGADAVAQDQPGVENVAEQPLGQRRHAVH